MAKIRRTRGKVATAQDALHTLSDLTRKNKAQELKVVLVKYEHLPVGKIKEALQDYLACVGAYAMIKYRLAQTAHALQFLMDSRLIQKGELSNTYQWKFKLINKKWSTRWSKDSEGFNIREDFLLAADLECYDVPGYTFASKLDMKYPADEASVQEEMGFVDWGDDNTDPDVPPAEPPKQPQPTANVPPQVPSQVPSQSTGKAVRRGRRTIQPPASNPASSPVLTLEEILDEKSGYDLTENPQVFLDHYNSLPDMDAKYKFWSQDSDNGGANFTDDERRIFYGRLDTTTRAELRGEMTTEEEQLVSDIT